VNHPVGEGKIIRRVDYRRGAQRPPRMDGSSRFCVCVRGSRRTRIRVRERQVILGSHCWIDGFRRAGRNAHIERIHYLAVAVVNADLS